jgi:hypothetical protein
MVVLGLAAATLGAPGVRAQEAAIQAVPVTPSINITPRRITFDRLGRTAAVYIHNPGAASGNFNIELVDRLMLPDGQLVPAADAASVAAYKPQLDRLQSARPLLLVTPRRTSLQANAGQTIRVRVGAASNIAPGEYRTHLTVTGIPPADAGLTVDNAAAQSAGALSFRISSVLGISIPVIVRVGPIDVRATIGDATISQAAAAPGGGKPSATLDLILGRTGRNSLFGNIEVRSERDRGEPLGLLRGIGVYTEIDNRRVSIPLSRMPAPGERITINFVDDDTAPGKVLASARINAP